MKTTIYLTDRRVDVLAVDVGGTNTSLAFIHAEGDRFAVERIHRFDTQRIPDLSSAIEEALGNAAQRPSVCCISGAGPVRGNVCNLTNVAWPIDGNAVASRFGFPTTVINDFSAICFGVPMLDPTDPSQLAALPHTDGSLPQPWAEGPSRNVRAIVGAGTGLGVGYLIQDGRHFQALPSEGGHSRFAPFDEESDAMRRYIVANTDAGTDPGVELFVSGKGLLNIYRYYRSQGRFSSPDVAEAIAAVPERSIPEVLSAWADRDADCADALAFFGRMYGRFACDMAVTFLPGAGVYVGGGIAAKIEPLLRKDYAFMRGFEATYNPKLRPILSTLPVFVIQDYNISLYGAAHAAVAMHPEVAHG